MKPYKKTPVFDQSSVPPGLGRDHATKDGVWALIHVLEGRLRYRVAEPLREEVLRPGVPGVVFPRQKHMVAPDGPVRFYVEFYAEAPVDQPSSGLDD